MHVLFFLSNISIFLLAFFLVSGLLVSLICSERVKRVRGWGGDGVRIEGEGVGGFGG
jgi:hypothetical protein